VTGASWISKLTLEVHRNLDNDSSGHDPFHAFRVRDLAIRIAEATGADVEVVEAAALLHDIGHASGRADHASRGATLAAEILRRCDFPQPKIPAVITCIEHHHWKPRRAGDPRTPTAEYKAFADADRLDALGAVGIARTFAFGGAHGRPIWNPDPNAARQFPYGISSVHHFYDKLLNLPDDMYTEIGRSLATRRVVLMEGFLRTFYAEWEARDSEFAREGIHAPLSLSPLSKRAMKVGHRIRRIFASILQPDPIN
jgi:uncharacterized protein